MLIVAFVSNAKTAVSFIAGITRSAIIVWINGTFVYLLMSATEMVLSFAYIPNARITIGLIT